MITYLPTYLHLIVESVVPQMLHVLPVADDAILHLIIIVYHHIIIILIIVILIIIIDSQGI